MILFTKKWFDKNNPIYLFISCDKNEMKTYCFRKSPNSKDIYLLAKMLDMIAKQSEE